MNGYMTEIHVGDYGVNVWVNCDKNAPWPQRVEAERKAVADAFDRVLSKWGMKCKTVCANGRCKDGK